MFKYIKDFIHKKNYIKEWCIERKYRYLDIKKYKHYELIYDLLKYGKVDETEFIKDNLTSRYCGMYYTHKKLYDKLIKYHLKAIEKGHCYSMNGLGIYYRHIKDTPNMMKYYLMGIEKGNRWAMCNLGIYYHQQDDYVNMMKYYLKAIEKGDPDALNCLGVYYRDLKEYDKMKKYYLKAIKKGNIDAMYNYGLYYDELQDYPNMKKYHLKAIKNGKTQAINALETYYFNHPQDYNKKEEFLILAMREGINKGLYKGLYTLGQYYQMQGVYDKMIKYYTMAINKGKEGANDTNDNKAMNGLGVYYYQQQNDIDAKKYFLMAGKKGNICAINNFLRIYDFDPELAYNNKNKLNSFNRQKLDDFIYNLLDEDYDEYRPTYIKLHTASCGVCYEIHLMQPLLTCTHFLCRGCHKKVDICPFCRKIK